MEIEYQLSRKDILEFGKLYLKDSIQKKIKPLFIITILLIAVINGQTFIWWRFLIALVASPAIIWIIYYFIPLIISIVRTNSLVKEDKTYFDKKKIMLLEEGIKTESEKEVNIWKWESIKSSHSNDKFIYFVLINKKAIPIPKRAFSAESEAINFCGLVQSRIIKIRGGSNLQINYINNRPPFLLGLICVIPFIGAFVGFGLLMFGIFKYKDKWLTIIGFAGIAWTVLFYSMLTYQLEYGAESRKAFAQISQMQINSLMKDIEFYKIKYGTYPDSLGQISKEDQMASINDPIQSLKFSKKGGEYNYQKVGSHYYLFSSGIDGIPNTKDDLYPQVAKSDSSKFGLIIKQ